MAPHGGRLLCPDCDKMMTEKEDGYESIEELLKLEEIYENQFVPRFENFKRMANSHDESLRALEDEHEELSDLTSRKDFENNHRQLLDLTLRDLEDEYSKLSNLTMRDLMLKVDDVDGTIPKVGLLRKRLIKRIQESLKQMDGQEVIARRRLERSR